MKKLLYILAISLFSLNGYGQDALQTELFSADVVMKYQTQINLTEGQNKSIKAIASEGSAKFNNAKWDLNLEQENLTKMLTETTVDQVATLKQMKTVNQLEEDLKLIRLEMLIQIKNQLSPEQQVKLKELRTIQDMSSINVSTAINNDKRVKLKVTGTRAKGDNPLYIIIDSYGETEVTSAKFEDLSPNNIESVTVLKGAKAKAKYGKRGKNGVIVVTLKN